VGVLGAVVEIAMLAVLYPRQHLLLCGAVAFELVGDDDPRYVSQAFEQLAEELLGRLLVPAALYQDIKPMALLIHGTPQIVPFTIDRQKHLVQVPLVARPGTPPAQSIGLGLPKLAAPLPNGFV
jgi:hypothetical protein